MLQAVKAIYENGKLKLLEKPNLKKAKAIVTFIESIDEIEGNEEINWKIIHKSSKFVKKWGGILKGRKIEELENNKMMYLKKKY